MSVSGQVRALLVADGAVTALVAASRIFSVKAPQGTPFPYIIIHKVTDGERGSFTSGNGAALEATVQITSYATTHLAASDIDEAVRGCLMEVAGALSIGLVDSRDMYDDETESFGVSSDFSVWR